MVRIVTTGDLNHASLSSKRRRRIYDIKGVNTTGTEGFLRGCVSKNGLFSVVDSPPEVCILINSRDSVDSTERNVHTLFALLDGNNDNLDEVLEITRLSYESTASTTTRDAHYSEKKRRKNPALTNFIHEVRKDDQTQETSPLLSVSKDTKSNISKLEMRRHCTRKHTTTKAAAASSSSLTKYTTTLLLLFLMMILLDCILNPVTAFPPDNSEDESDSFWHHFSESHEKDDTRDSRNELRSLSSSQSPSSSSLSTPLSSLRKARLDSALTSSVLDQQSSSSSRVKASDEYTSKQRTRRLTTNLSESSREIKNSESSLQTRKLRRSINMLSDSSILLIESDVDSFAGDDSLLDRNEEDDSVKRSEKKTPQNSQDNGLHVIKSKRVLDEESRELFMDDDSTVVSKTGFIESIPTPAKLQLHKRPSTSSASSSAGRGWDLFGDEKIRSHLGYLRSQHSANAVLHLIELLATQNQSSSSSSKSQSSFGDKDWFCIRTTMNDLNFPLDSLVYKSYSKQASIAVRTANLLTSLFMSSVSSAPTLFVDQNFFFRRKEEELSPSSVSSHPSLSPINESLSLDKSFFWALSQLNMQSDDKLSGAGIAFADKVSFPIRIDGKTSPSSTSSNHPFFRSSSGEVDESGTFFAPFVSKSSGGSSLNFVDLSLSPSSLLPSSNPSISSSKSYHKIDWFRKHAANRSLTEIDLNNFNNIFFSSHSSSARRQSSQFPSRTSSQDLHDDSRAKSEDDASDTSSRDGDWVHLDDGFWTSPYLDCLSGNNWQLTYSVPFFAPSNPEGNKITFRGVAVISIRLDHRDIDQCSTDASSLFSNTHKCHQESTRCLKVPRNGLRRGSYICQCKPGYYIPQEINPSNNSNKSQLPDIPINTTHYFEGSKVEAAFAEAVIATMNATSPSNKLKKFSKDFSCIPCQPGCESCIDDTPCFVSHDVVLRSTALGFQSFCATICILLAFAVCRLRRDKTIAASRWIMIEMMLLGAFLLYLTIVLRYFESTPMICLVEPWLRELGFGFFYGSAIIKLYRILAEFQTRKAHRVCVRDKDLLKYLSAVIFVIVGYLAAWTALLLDAADGFSNMSGKLVSSNIIMEAFTSEGLKFHFCRELSWYYVTEIGEVCFLLAGVYITYCIRNARTEIYREKWTLCWIIYIELIVSSSTYITRHLFSQKLHPDVIFLLYFARCQLTVTLALFMLLFPKLWYRSRPQGSSTTKNRSRFFSSSDVENRVPEAMKLHSAVLSNGELDIADVNLADMDTTEVAAELRRCYTQIEILRNKTMRKDNPHISKRRGGRKGTHRRFSLQPFTHKPSSHHHHHEHHSSVIPEGREDEEEATKSSKKSNKRAGKSSIHDYMDQTEVSRTPEESTASVEGNPGFNDQSGSSNRKTSGPGP